jgi:hypothetical protein
MQSKSPSNSFSIQHTIFSDILNTSFMSFNLGVTVTYCPPYMLFEIGGMYVGEQKYLRQNFC